MDTLIKRKNPALRRTMGYDNVDKLLARPAEPQELSIIIGAKGSGKSLMLKAFENSMVNTGQCVISFNLEMSASSNYDRLLSMRERIPLATLLMKDGISARDEAKIHKGIERIQEIENYYYYPDPSLSFKELDDYIYMAKKKFKIAGVLPEDGYTVVTVDLGDMIEEFSGKDPYALKAAVNKLSIINRKHNCHIILLLQSNENNLRGGKSFPNPESCDNFSLQIENVEGGSAYAARARVVMAINRPLLLKRRFFPARQEEWDVETDVMYLNVLKQNDGKLGRCGFIFPDDSFRIEPYDLQRRN
jgi:KaiC/GvpD/RAD55 family RecA-like ATPase